MLIVMGQTGNRTLEKAASSHTSPDNEQEMSSPRAHLVEILSELRDLLVDYAPAWYTEEHHQRVESALRARQRH